MTIVGVPREVKTGRAPGRDHARRRRTSWRTAASPCSSSPAPGVDSSITDDEYRGAGAEIVDDRGGGLGRAEHGPQGEGAAGATSSRHLRPGLVLFTYLHLAAYPEVADALLDAKATGHRVRDGADSQRARCRCSRR